ncbi:fumarylacetoacetate hydrolase family protein [Lentzea sp. NPDC051213]|uniref:fumarylacetoacetate hydrolase family protein n=1 Tax=Lentzea sp. NPDC051213 TaxID=3364126 RepID=UPI00379B78DF
MKLVTFSSQAGERVGVVDLDREVVRDVTHLLPDGGGLLGAIEQWDAVRPLLDARTGTELPLEKVHVLAPIPRPRRNIFCVGLNYHDHVTEYEDSDYGIGNWLPDRPVIFSKATTAVIGTGTEIDRHPAVTSEVDYEGELAVIIGTGAQVWGYTIVNDVTARDLQHAHKQWLVGKSLDTFCPMGPYVVTADEVPDVAALEIRTKVNGELRQHASLKDLIFDVPDLIATLSAGITLLPGDVLATGTPAGVGLSYDPPAFLRSGDVVEVSITGLGTLRNRVR